MSLKQIFYKHIEKNKQHCMKCAQKRIYFFPQKNFTLTQMSHKKVEIIVVGELGKNCRNRIH